MVESSDAGEVAERVFNNHMVIRSKVNRICMVESSDASEVKGILLNSPVLSKDIA